MYNITGGDTELGGEGAEEPNDVLEPIILGPQNLVGIGEH
jgi:hypothetical protein